MRKTATQRKSYDAHIYLDPELWAQLERMATKETRSITAMIRVLIKEGVAARKNGRA
jgi:hypothetical protein